MSSSVQLAPPASPPPLTPVLRERKSTNKYTQKNNRYRDRLAASEGHKLAILKARSANNTYISRAKTAFVRVKRAELENLCEEDRGLASEEIGRLSRKHSILAMLHLNIHWVQKARQIAPAGLWPSIDDILRKEGITKRQYNNFEPDSKPGVSRGWDVDLSKFKPSPCSTQKKSKSKT